MTRMPLRRLITAAFMMVVSTETVSSANDLTVRLHNNDHILISKCCSSEELMDDTIHCIHVNATDSQPWAPIFTNERGENNIQVKSK